MDIAIPGDLLQDVVTGFERLVHATTLAEQSAAYESLSNDMSDLSSYHPNYDLDTGTIVDTSA